MGQDMSPHGKTLLVIRALDLDYISLPLFIQDISIYFCDYALLIESMKLAFTNYVNEFITAGGWRGSYSASAVHSLLPTSNFFPQVPEGCERLQGCGMSLAFLLLFTPHLITLVCSQCYLRNKWNKIPVLKGSRTLWYDWSSYGVMCYWSLAHSLQLWLFGVSETLYQVRDLCPHHSIWTIP